MKIYLFIFHDYIDVCFSYYFNWKFNLWYTRVRMHNISIWNATHRRCRRHRSLWMFAKWLKRKSESQKVLNKSIQIYMKPIPLHPYHVPKKTHSHTHTLISLFTMWFSFKANLHNTHLIPISGTTDYVRIIKILNKLRYEWETWCYFARYMIM